MDIPRPIHLAALPRELLQKIFGYIHDTPLLLKLSLMCRAFHIACLPSLYHTICLEKYDMFIYPDYERKFEGLVDPSNPGLRYVRRLLLHHSTDYSLGNYGLDVFVERLLEVLPQDSLQSIRAFDACGGSCRCDLLCTSNLVLLSQTQRHVRDIWLDSTCLPMTDEDTWSVVESTAPLKSLKDLKLCFHNQDLIPIYQISSDLAQQNITKIETLTICCGLQDDPEAPGTSLPKGFLTFGLSNQIVLRKLKFFNFDFADFDFDSFNNAFRYFEGLEDLEVNGCHRARSLISSFTPNRLTRLCVRHFEEPRDAITGALEFFLQSFEPGNSVGLRTLTVILDRAQRLPNIKCITAHSETLTQLVVCARNRFGAYPRSFSAATQDLWPVRYSLDELSKIFRSCTKLRQLSLSLEKEAGPNWYLMAFAPLKSLQTFLDVPWLHFDPHRGTIASTQAPLINAHPLIATATRVFSELDQVGVHLKLFSTSKVIEARARRFYFVRDPPGPGGVPRLVSKERLLQDPDVECGIINEGHHFRGETETAGF